MTRHEVAHTRIILQMHNGGEDHDTEENVVKWVGVDNEGRALGGRTDLTHTGAWVKALFQQGWSELKVFRRRCQIAAIHTHPSGERTWWSE